MAKNIILTTYLKSKILIIKVKNRVSSTNFQNSCSIHS